MATYHGLIKVSCLVCNWESTDDSTIEIMKDMDENCPRCDQQFFRWENFNSSITVSLKQQYDGMETFDTLTYMGGK